MKDVAEAQRIIADACAMLPVDRVPLRDALSHVLAETVAADRDFPPTDRSAMDGFAVVSADLDANGGTLNVVGEVQAGAEPAKPLSAGEAMRIFTGAVVPPGADAVVMVEDTVEDRAGGTVAIQTGVRTGQHIRRRGSDLTQDQLVLEPRTLIRPAEQAALASVGCTRPQVYRKPRVAVLSTGDEIVEPEVVPLPHQIRNSNATTLLAQLRQIGLDPTYVGIASDTPDALAERLAKGLEADVLLITGGVSVGEYDLVGAGLEQAGMELLFHKVAMKPGKPILCGRTSTCLVFGLPGNPVSTFAGFEVFVAPALRRMMGRREPEIGPHEVPVRLTAPITTRPGRRTYHLAWIANANDGRIATPVKATGSGDVLAMARANGFVITGPDAAGAPEGATLKSILWGRS